MRNKWVDPPFAGGGHIADFAASVRLRGHGPLTSSSPHAAPGCACWPAWWSRCSSSPAPRRRSPARAHDVAARGPRLQPDRLADRGRLGRRRVEPLGLGRALRARRLRARRGRGRRRLRRELAEVCPEGHDCIGYSSQIGYRRAARGPVRLYLPSAPEREPRGPAIATATAAHELGHVLGLEHRDGCSIMNSQVLALSCRDKTLYPVTRDLPVRADARRRRPRGAALRRPPLARTTGRTASSAERQRRRDRRCRARAG